MYISAKQAACEWGVSLRQAQRLMANGRIPEARKFGRSWMVPANTEKPRDLRREGKAPHENTLSYQLNNVIERTIQPAPKDNPDAILDTIGGARLRLQLEAELAYLRGDFEKTIDCFRAMDDEASRLRASSVTIAAAVSMGDYPLYLEVEAFLKGIVQGKGGDNITCFAELSLATAYTGAMVPSMLPEWLKEGDFKAIHPLTRLDAVYKRAKYFQCLGHFESMLVTAQTAISLRSSEQGLLFHDVYFPVVCAIAYHALGHSDEAKHWLVDALKLALPHGFITPFTESASTFGGLLEQLLEREFPAYYDAIMRQWKRTFANWLTFHNRFTKDNITLILSLREYEMACLVARRIPRAKIAKQFHISAGRLNNIMKEIYGKLFVSGREELSKFIL